MIRPAAVAGRFYPADPLQLKKQIEELLPPDSKKISARACLVPHAAYIYSGRVAASVYASLDLPSRLILLGPRHFPRGERLAIVSQGNWRTPFGDAPIDESFAAEIKSAFPPLREDARAHSTEHSLEVQLPFLQHLVPNFTFVPIVLGTDRFEILEALGHAIAQAIAAHAGEKILLLTSSDMNHYATDAATRVKDRKAIDAILALDARRLYDTIHRESISMCGYAAAVVMLVAVRDLQAEKAHLVTYATSAEVNGDYDSVVGYAGIIVD